MNNTKIRIGINGFGRIGRRVLRTICEKEDDIEVVGINDLISTEYMAYLLKHDSVHGPFKGEVSWDDAHLIVNNKKIRVTSEQCPERLRWDEIEAEYVIESTGQFLTHDKAYGHIVAGANYVIMSATPKDDTPMFVCGINSDNYAGEQILSNASCSTYCLAPIVKVIDDNFGLVEGLMTTVHAMTSSQNTVDGRSEKDWRAGRASLSNIIPSSTGAAKAVCRVIPSMQGRLTSMAFRVPNIDVSVVDLTCRLEKSATFEEICACIKAASQGALKGVLGYTEDEVVSTDFVGESCTSVFDVKASIALNDHFVKLISWYDNESGYSSKLLMLIHKIHRYNREKR